MDTIVRVFCVGLLGVTAVVLFDNVRLLLQLNRGKKTIKSENIDIKKPTLLVHKLLKGSLFFLMTNHGPDLCESKEEVENVPYYKGKEILMDLGEGNEKD